MAANLGYDLIIRILATSAMLLRESQRFFRPHGLTEAQFNVLNLLGMRPDGMSQRELGELLVVDRSNVTGLLDRLEKTGWVAREDHPVDRRIYCVKLTKKGKDLLDKVLPKYLDAVKDVTSGLSADRIKSTMELLRSLEDSANAWGKKSTVKKKGTS